MPPFTKRAVDIFAPQDLSGVARPVENEEVQRWGTEVESAARALYDFGVFIYDESGSINMSTAFTATKSLTENIKVPSGTLLLNDFYDIATDGVISFEHGVDLIKPGGGLGTPAINGIQIGEFMRDRNRSQARSGGMVLTPSGKFKADYSAYDGDDAYETILDAVHLWYNRTAENAYDVGATLRETFINYGFGGPSSGTVASYGSRINLHEVAESESGRSEITPIAQGTISLSGYDQKKVNFYNDIVFSLPKSQQEAFAAGISIAMRKHNQFEAVDANHNGAYGLVIQANPQITGFNAPQETTYPMLAGIAITGRSGAPSVGDGHDVGAGPGWRYGITIGHDGGGVWGGWNAKSKLDNGVSMKNFLYKGLEIFGAHPEASDPAAIWVYPDGGKTMLGIGNGVPSGSARLHVGTGGSGAGDSIRLYAAPGTNKRTTINLNNDIALMTDVDGNGNRSGGLWSNSAGFFIFTFNAAGEIFFSNLPTTASGGRMYRDTNGFFRS